MRRILLVLLLIPAPAVGQPYFSTGFGVNAGSELESIRSGAPIPRSICDEYINPRYAELSECAGPGRRNAWTSVFDRAAGVLGGAAGGYRAGQRFRLEVEYFYRDSAYDQTSPILGASGETRERIAGEVARAREHVYSMTSHNLFGNAYVDFDTGGRVTPYLGLGLGAGVTELDNGRVLARHVDPAAITSVPDHVPNAEEVRRSLAGTTSTLHTTETDTMRAYQLLFGADFALAEAASLGFQGTVGPVRDVPGKRRSRSVAQPSAELQARRELAGDLPADGRRCRDARSDRRVEILLLT